MKEVRRDRPAAAAGGGELGAQELIPLQDRRLRLQCAVCFMALGFCMLIQSTDHVFAGFFIFIVSAALMLFTLGGGDARRVE